MSADWVEAFDEFALRADEFVDAGERVVVRVVVEGRGSGSGVPVSATAWFVYGVHDRKLITIDMYAEREQVLEAAGLSK